MLFNLVPLRIVTLNYPTHAIITTFHLQQLVVFTLFFFFFFKSLNSIKITIIDYLFLKVINKIYYFVVDFVVITHFYVDRLLNISVITYYISLDWTSDEFTGKFTRRCQTHSMLISPVAYSSRIQ